MKATQNPPQISSLLATYVWPLVFQCEFLGRFFRCFPSGFRPRLQLEFSLRIDNWKRTYFLFKMVPFQGALVHFRGTKPKLFRELVTLKLWSPGFSSTSKMVRYNSWKGTGVSCRLMMMMMMMMIGDHHKPFSGRMFEGMMHVGLGMMVTSETETSSTAKKNERWWFVDKESNHQLREASFFQAVRGSSSMLLWQIHVPWDPETHSILPLKIGAWKRMHFLSGFSLSGAFAASFSEHIPCLLHC